MTKGILLLILCQLLYLTPAYLSNDPNFVHVAVPVSNQAESKSNTISLELEIQNNLTTPITWANSYTKLGGMKKSFYHLGPKDKASFLATTMGKGKGSLQDPYPEEEQNTTSGIVTLNIGGKSNALTLFWEVSSNVDIPNSIGYYWGNQTSSANMYELILNEQLSNSFVKKSYETWTKVDLVGDIKMALFISDQKEAKAMIILWEEKTYLPEGYYTISFDADMGKELCLEYTKDVAFAFWGYCEQNDVKQQWIIQRNATNSYTIRSNYDRSLLLIASSIYPVQVANLDGRAPHELEYYKFSLVKKDNRWRVFNLLAPTCFWTADLGLDMKYYKGNLGIPACYQLICKLRDDSYSNQLFNFNLIKFTSVKL